MGCVFSSEGPTNSFTGIGLPNEMACCLANAEPAKSKTTKRRRHTDIVRT